MDYATKYAMIAVKVFKLPSAELNQLSKLFSAWLSATSRDNVREALDYTYLQLKQGKVSSPMKTASRRLKYDIAVDQYRENMLHPEDLPFSPEHPNDNISTSPMNRK